MQRNPREIELAPNIIFEKNCSLSIFQNVKRHNTNKRITKYTITVSMRKKLRKKCIFCGGSNPRTMLLVVEMDIYFIIVHSLDELVLEFRFHLQIKKTNL